MRTARYLIAFVLLAGLPALAQSTDTAAWNRDLERLDHYLAPPQGGDNDFFTGISNLNDNTNVTLVFAANSRMNRFTQRLFRIRRDLQGSTPLWQGANAGCNNDYLNNLTYFMTTTVAAPHGPASLQGTYSPTKTYPEPITNGKNAIAGSGNSSANGYAGFVNNDNTSDGLVTSVGNNPAAYRFTNWPAGASASGTAESYDTACNTANAALKDQCKACLASHGYWLNPIVQDSDISPSAGVFTTNWLRFHPVEWVMITMAYKRLVAGPLLSPLREAVVVPNGANGGSVAQKMLPQSCHGQGTPQNQKLNAIDGVLYSSDANPLAEMLFNTAWYMGGQNNPWVFTGDTGTQGGAAMQNGNSGPCPGGCANNDFIVLFSNGRGDAANPSCTNNGSKAAFCTANASCSTVGLGTESDGDNYDLMSNSSGSPHNSTTASPFNFTADGQRTGLCDTDVADDVANFIATHTVSTSSSEKIPVYVIGIGDPNNTYGEMSILPAIAGSSASRGNNPVGKYYVADDFQSLEANINDAFNTIISQSTSFSSAAVTTVQTQGVTSTFIPRFRPLTGANWNGSLQRYNLFNEFSAGCTTADYNKKDSVNPNGNNSCFDVYLTDSNGNFVTESNGSFVQLDTSAAWDGGWPVKTTNGQPDGGTYPASPFWEAAQVLTSRENAAISGNTAKERTIYTVAPSSANDGTYDPTLIPFDVAHASTIAPLLALGGVNGDFCTELGTMTRNLYATEADCAADLIRFMNGRDVMMQNPANRPLADGGLPSVMSARPNILGDIFHSTPVLVTPPAPTYLCDLGVINQCVPSLYSSTMEAQGPTAYAAFQTSVGYRTEFVLVGSNDGMLHAFNAGNDTVNAAGAHSYDLGTGDELWAFIPPDMLPKLTRYVLGSSHDLFVDGSPMVRDIWVDGSGASSVKDHIKQSDEFHTVAVIGDREGGRHYTALDVSDPTTPRFLWTWPKAGTNDGMFKGGAWNDLGPAAAPIGPIAEYDSAGTFTVNGVKARERYVVAVGGGFDPNFLRGRSIHVLDAWTGQQVYRFAQKDSLGGNDPRKYLGEVVAPVSLLDSNSDGLFDTAVVGDTNGQLWTVSMLSPGQDLDGDGRYDNWFGGRAFVEFKGDKFYKRSPFFQRTGAAITSPGVIRVFAGAGDRYQIKEADGGTCSLANLEACVRKDCTVSVSSSAYDVGGPTGHSVTSAYYAAANALDQDGGITGYVNTTGVAASDVDDATLNWSLTCGGANAAVTQTLTCNWSAGVDGGVDCPNAITRPVVALSDAGAQATMANSYFYSVRLFDPTRPQFASDAGAVAYDLAALNESNLVNADTTTTTDTGNGWYVVHARSIDEKTSSSPLILGGCVSWKTLVPNPNRSITCGAPPPLDTTYLYQADLSTGAVQCGQAGSATYSATARYTSNASYVVEQQPSPVVSVNSVTGQVAYGSISLDPGTPPSAVTVGTSDLVAPIQWLEVPRKVHDCRHGGTNCQ